MPTGLRIDDMQEGSFSETTPDGASELTDTICWGRCCTAISNFLNGLNFTPRKTPAKSASTAKTHALESAWQSAFDGSDGLMLRWRSSGCS